MSTAACESAITYLDGDAGILRYRGYPIEQLAEQSTYLEVAYLLLARRAADHRPVRRAGPTRSRIHTFIHENVRKRFLDGFHYDAHPMGMLVSAVAALSTFYLDAKEIFDPALAQQADRPADRQDAHPGRGRPPLQRRACPSSTRTTRSSFAANFLSMMWKVAEPRFEADPVLARALDVLFILHADHEQNCSTTAMRVVGSSHADPYSATRRGRAPPSTAPATAGPTRRSSGCSPRSAPSTTSRPSSRTVKAGKGRLQGFGHRVYKNYDPRATIIKRTADEVFEVTGQEPAARHRPQAGGDRPLGRVLHLPQALPERRLLLRAHLPGHGLPAGDVHGALRHPPDGRAGWPTGRRCSTRTPRSPGPASSTSAPRARDYVPVADR